MSADRDVTRIVRSWLKEDAHEDATRVLNAALAEADATPQRRAAGLAWRSPIMNNMARIAAAVAAAVIVLFIGYRFLLGPPTGGPGPAETATPSPTATPVSAVPLPRGALVPGTTYSLTRGAATFTFEVPVTGWENDGSFVLQGHAGSQDETYLWFFDNVAMYGDAGEMPMAPAVFDDPCSHDTMQTFAATASGQLEAFTSIPGTEVVEGPTAITTAAGSAQRVTIAVPADLGCANSEFWLVFNTNCGTPTINCSNFPTWPGEAIHEWFIDNGGEVFEVRAEVRNPDGAEPALPSELQQIVDSIRIE
jgi:hypothetical protein